MPQRSLTILLPAALLALGPALGCSGGDPPREPGVIRIAMADEPPILDSTRATDALSHFVLGHLMEGLTRVGKSGETIPGVAERWEISERGATFHLRASAVWEDGVPVKAKDFVFAWRTAVEPKTASEYAFILFPVKNAEAINQGKLPSTALGVRAVDDRTLVVEFERPTGTFLILTPFSTFLPVREDFYRAHAGRYFADASDALCNGPYRLPRWVHGASLVFERNERYWDAANIHIRRIEIPYITSDPTAPYNLFKDGKIDQVGLDRELLGRAQADRFRMKPFADGSVWYAEFNHRPGRVTRNVHLRRAMQLAFDPREFVSKVIGIPGTVPGVRLVPRWVRGVSQPFFVEYPIKPWQVDLDAAHRELELAKKELGGELPPLVWLMDEGPAAARQAEYFQYLFASRLGISLKIDKQIFKQRLDKMTSGEFDIVAAGWGPDYLDAMTFADLFTSWNENNRGHWRNERYDALIRKALGTVDPKGRMDAMAEAERVLVEEVGILPMYERSRVYVHDPRLIGVVRHQTQPDPDYTWARFEP